MNGATGDYQGLLVEAARRLHLRLVSSIAGEGEFFHEIYPRAAWSFGLVFRGSEENGLIWITLPTGDQVGPVEVAGDDREMVGQMLADLAADNVTVRLRKRFRKWYPVSVAFSGVTLWIPSESRHALMHQYPADEISATAPSVD